MQIEGNWPQGPYLLTDGANARHISRVSSSTSILVSSECLALSF